MKENTTWYWEQKQKQKGIIVPTRTIVYPCLDVMVVKYFHGIPRSFCSRNKSIQALQRHPICFIDSDDD